jgi:peptide/nickel transport system substrate-binding protein
MKRSVLLLVLAFLAALVAPAALAQDDSEVILRIGLTQDWETLNPTVGFAVSEYEVWNVHYATLTDKAAADFEPIPGLAESWTASDDGLTYTYTLREDLKWSDGEPLTADDIVWNINTGRDQKWDNMISTVVNFDAVKIDDRTIEVTSSVPDPKLPNLDVYLLPQHIWEPIATDYDAATEYDALDGVGSGPFVIESFTKGQSVVMVANPNYWGWEGEEPAIDKVIFQLFSNPDAMVAALKQNELDAAQGFPAGAAADLEADPNITVVAGQQGGFDEIAINGGAVAGQPHPALLDLEVRRAINFGIDKEAVIEDLWFGLADPLETVSPGADPSKWVPEIPADKAFSYDPQNARDILDAAGYVDSDGDGVREMPDGTNPIILRHAINTDGDLAQPIAELFKGWMEDIGIGVEFASYDQDALYGVIIEGDYDTFFWGWVPFVDPDPMLSYFTAAELESYNDANWTDPRFEELYLEQKVELDSDRRVEIVHEMLTILHDSGVYIPMYLGPDLQAYRTDTFEGWVQQPAEIGPVMFSNSSPSYAVLHPVGSDAPGGEADSGTNWLLIGGIAAAVAVVGGLLVTRRKSSADDRE